MKIDRGALKCMPREGLDWPWRLSEVETNDAIV